MDAKRDYSWVYRGALEGALIVFAVILGFLVTEWREDRRAEAKARVAIERIVLELDANIRQLEQVAPYHRDTSQAIGRHIGLIQSGEVSERGRFIEEAMAIMPRGLAPPLLNRTAWDYAVTSGVLDPVEYDVVADVASVYALQERGVDSTWREMASTMFLNQENMMERELAPRFQLLSLMFQELALQEEYLLILARDARDDARRWLGQDLDADEAGDDAA